MNHSTLPGSFWTGTWKPIMKGNRMKMRQFLVFPYPEEVGLAPSWAAGVVRDGKDEKMVPTEAVVFMLAGSREGKMEIPESKVNELGPKEDCEEQNAIPARR